MKLFQQGMALFLSWSLVLAGVQDGFAYQTQAPAQALQQSPQQLQQLVAPSRCTLRDWLRRSWRLQVIPTKS